MHHIMNFNSNSHYVVCTGMNIYLCAVIVAMNHPGKHLPGVPRNRRTGKRVNVGGPNHPPPQSIQIEYLGFF